MLQKTIKGKKFNTKSISGPKQRNSSATDKKVLEFLLERCKNCLPVTREMTQMKSLEDAISFNTMQQDIKASNR
jgi:hypothetical protein